MLNPSAQQSLQYGYLNLVPGLDRITTSAGAAVSESTALLTFFNDTATERVINNGPIRVVDRTGTGAIYFGSGNADLCQSRHVQKRHARPDLHFAASGRDRHLDRLLHDHIRNDDHRPSRAFQIDGKTHRLGHPQECIGSTSPASSRRKPRPPRILPAQRMGPAAQIVEKD